MWGSTFADLAEKARKQAEELSTVSFSSLTKNNFGQIHLLTFTKRYLSFAAITIIKCSK